MSFLRNRLRAIVNNFLAQFLPCLTNPLRIKGPFCEPTLRRVLKTFLYKNFRARKCLIFIVLEGKKSATEVTL